RDLRPLLGLRALGAALASVPTGGGRLRRRTYQTAAIAAEIAVPLAILVAWQAWTVHAQDPKFPPLSTILVQFRELWLFSPFRTSSGGARCRPRHCCRSRSSSSTRSRTGRRSPSSPSSACSRSC